MARVALVLSLIVAAGSVAAAQDRLKFKDPKRTSIPCEVLSLNFKTVVYEITAGESRVKQNTDAKEIQDIEIDRNKMTFDFAQAESAMNNGNFQGAAERFDRVQRDSRATQLLKQAAAINVARCYWQMGNTASALSAIRAMRQRIPDSFYLPHSYELEIKCHLARGDVSGAARAVSEFEGRGRSEGVPDWSKAADVMRGELFELEGKWRDALKIHRKYARDAAVGQEAALGELRCLEQIRDWTGLNGKAESLLSRLRKEKLPDRRLLTGAYNARAAAKLNGGQVRGALLDYMRGVDVVNKGGGGTREHEASLAGATIACARFASSQADGTKKGTYKTRAEELLYELNRRYPKSRLRDAALKAIQGVK